MKKSSSVDQSYNLWVLLHQARDAVLRARDRELRQYGLLTMQSAVLYVLHALGDKATPAEISRWLLRERHSVSSLLSRMEKEGLVRMTKDLDRKNMIRVVMTEKGKQAYQQSIRRESIHNTTSSLSKEEVQQMVSYLKRLRDSALKEAKLERTLPFP